MEDEFKFLKSKIISGRVYLDLFPFDKNDLVINIGCGEGPQAIVYAGHYKKMIGVDISKERLEKSKEIMKIYNIDNYETLCANIEEIPFPDKSFDKAIAIDVIEHVQNPEKLCLEANRLLKGDGKFLITFSTMYDKYRNLASMIKHFKPWIKNKNEKGYKWNPDAHNQSHSPKQWIALVERCGFKLLKSRANTLFPPLHLYGFPKFWFTNNIIYKITNFFCKIPVLKNYGQALVCVFEKNKVI
ncbi:MAG: hypothetical protein A2V69_01415 [Candidatus Portnoybacteria bacterium RBG_13_40_8]|uniref:Methyltransferase type 11 domain-containing protein n=1 Tax=Candidatus Portnoybacteria bacterium RBG_13_40_8 TaxID=1801990 RepID=A0A1G2F566_9BACT|nr:MAG: hypothetical protein A2V69_01415 [Candidatus Portnoybacteria bacterium RBG_13_40_8]OGZ35167.1 MAG: hypothetical protein A2V60_00475 [Candidatus Portnoybacteria bacterium RIFCSPHIGHO2_01_FULL_39_19]